MTKSILTFVAKRLFAHALLSLVLGTLTLSAQDVPGRFEVGASFNTSHNRAGDGLNYQTYGPGVEGTVNFGPHLAFDASYAALRNNFPYQMAVFGLKAGVRIQRFGIFGKVRPGFVSYGKVLRDSTIVFDPGPPAVTLGTQAHVNRLTEKALDLGGVIEYYPARHWAIRWDLGDTLIFQEKGPTFTAVPVGGTPIVTSVPARTDNNFQFSTGVHYKF